MGVLLTAETLDLSIGHSDISGHLGQQDYITYGGAPSRMRSVIACGYLI
jgi:hypothetical protein